MSISSAVKREKIPVRLVKLTELAVVPRSEYLPAPVCSDPFDEKKRRSFFGLLRGHENVKPAEVTVSNNLSVVLNAALWMKVLTDQAHVVSFFLVYGDDSGEYAVLVDEVKVSADHSAVMLTNNVSIQCKGEVKFVKACCSGLADSKYVIDELFVQRVKEAAVQQNKKTA
ncbi:MAG: hypothetical protein H7A01_14325 [Hahellaceae bacterium]|nr:hypothetical protein [Hahellaceae bacterium]MCP5210233.1 hypothetical protein [Hahellaceae bacterium]